MACCPKQCPVLSGTKAMPGSGRFCLAAMRHWIQFGSATVTLGCCGFGSPDRQRAGARWQQAFEAKPTLATGDMHLGMASAELCRGRVPCLLEGCHVLTYDHGSAIDVTGGGCAVSPARTPESCGRMPTAETVCIVWHCGGLSEMVWVKYLGPWGLPPDCHRIMVHEAGPERRMTH
jgi:hypothetical protein